MYPQHVRMSDDCKNIISAMLQKDPAARITLEQAKSHPWFKSIDWEKLSRKDVISPFIPPTSGTDWVSGFDEDFTSEPPVNSFCRVGLGVFSGD
jgi:serine/threonine protein kinase